MKKIFICSILLVFIASKSYSQVSEIIEHSGKSSTSKHSSSSSSTSEEHSSSSGDDCSEACVGACAEVCLQVAGSIMFDALVAHHRYQMANRDKDPTVLSLDIMPHFFKSIDTKYDNMTILPRLRGTWGILSSEVYVNQLVELGDLSNYRTVSWQIIQLNFEAIPSFNFRIGSGILWEVNSQTDSETKQKNVCSESSICMDFKLQDLKYIISLEGRSAWGETGNVYNSVDCFGSLRLINTKHLFVYAIAGINFQNYYTSVDWFSARTGLTFNIH